MRKPLNILMLEDDDVDARQLCRALNVLPAQIYDIIRLKNGQEGLDWLDKHPEETKRPWIILLDLKMPLMGGREFLQRLRENNMHDKHFIVVLSTSDHPDDKHFATQMRVDAYYNKSILQENPARFMQDVLKLGTA
ncbi:MAG: two-component system response regulator [Rickettsiales bacterium]|nr:two-component system response regulator [Rickettsiales bacterium]|tara:strand:- start:3350 stop:3757 length:408 start_codon:yes stop_codon:yes gene_type:complete